MRNNLLHLFWTFFKIGATTFGGGYAMLPIIKHEVVERNSWISDEEFVDVVAVAQSVPGAVAVNSSIFIGYKVRGYPGAFAGMLGTVLPSFIVILLIAAFFVEFTKNKIVAAAFAGIRPAVVALIAAAVVRLGKPVVKTKENLILVVIFLLLAAVFDFHPILLILAGAAVGLVRNYLKGKKDKLKGSSP